MRTKSLSGAWITTVISLIGVDIGILGGSAAVAQEAVCGTIESDPPTYPDPDEFPPLPAYCFGPGGPGPNVCTDNGCIIDVLVVYTPAAKNAALASGTTINDKIGEAVDAMNIAFANSLIPSFVRLVGTAEVAYDETDDASNFTALNCLSSSGCMPLAHFLRNQLKADILSLFVTTIPGTVAGQTGYDPSDGFNVVEWTVAARNGYWVFAHETGHNLGARHQAANPCTTALPSDCHAYLYFEGAEFRWSTIMRTVAGGNIQHYSNPDVSYQGSAQVAVPTGFAGCANNARCIRAQLPNRAHHLHYGVSDCNNNGFCDAHDIAVGTSLDCEHNGIPDDVACQTLNGNYGGCCLNGTCTLKTEICCVYEGGAFKGFDSGLLWSDCGADSNLNGIDDACESPGACCRYYPYNTVSCQVVLEDWCAMAGGTFHGPGTRCGGDDGQNYIPDGCESGPSNPFGACCYYGMWCDVGLESYCLAHGGTFGGAGTLCEDCNSNGWPAPCEGPTTHEYGACCTLEGGCIIATECSCQGQFLGVGTSCEPVGACCVGTTCSVGAQTCCNNAGGTFKGTGTNCQDCTVNGVADVCEPSQPIRACCLPPEGDGPCIETTPQCCENDGGTFLWETTTCEPWPCYVITYGPSQAPPEP